jgi:hypothetical protein
MLIIIPSLLSFSQEAPKHIEAVLSVLTGSLVLVLLNEVTLLKERGGSAAGYSHGESLAEHTQQAVSLNIILSRG